MKYYLVLAALVCVSAALPAYSEEEDDDRDACGEDERDDYRRGYRNVDSQLGEAGRNDAAGGSRGGIRAGGAAQGAKAGGGVVGESGAERKQDYNKETRTVVVKSEKDSGRATEDEWAKGAGSAGGSSKGVKVNADKGGQKGGFGSSKGAGYEGAGYEKGDRNYRVARSASSY